MERCCSHVSLAALSLTSLSLGFERTSAPNLPWCKHQKYSCVGHCQTTVNLVFNFVFLCLNFAVSQLPIVDRTDICLLALCLGLAMLLLACSLNELLVSLQV